MSSLSPCSNPGCNKVGKSQCAACLQVSYCGQTCQKTHWPNHKKSCKSHRQQHQQTTEEILIDKAGPCSWMGRDDLVSVILSSKVTSIGDAAFSLCKQLQSIMIHDSVTSIGKNAFFECKQLRSIVIPDSVTNIGAQAFWGCSGLTSVVIPDSVTDIGADAFQGCTQLQQVIAPARFHHLFPRVASLTEPSQYVLK
jgi:hypothetical protein